MAKKLLRAVEDALVSDNKLKQQYTPYPLPPSLNICSIIGVIMRGFAKAARIGKDCDAAR